MRVKINQSELQRLVAEDLNKQGIQPPRKDKWESHNVQMAISRKLNYPPVGNNQPNFKTIIR